MYYLHSRVINYDIHSGSQGRVSGQRVVAGSIAASSLFDRGPPPKATRMLFFV